MILSFHPCVIADSQVILADRKLNAADRRLIQSADVIILPQSCSRGLFNACKKSGALIFPNYDVRFKYPGKLGQSLVFEKLRIPHPVTRRWSSVRQFKAARKGKRSLAHPMPFFLKTDRGHEGEGVFFVFDAHSLGTSLGRLEQAGTEGFISQEAISCKGNVLRAVVLHRRIITYWKRPARYDETVTTISHGSRVDRTWEPALQEKARELARHICEKTGINVAAFDFVFDLDQPDPRALVLEINYYFGRRGLGGSLAYYGLLLKAIKEWLKETGVKAGRLRLA